ncbi:MAG TPA: hypothetical protein VFL92_00415 [Sphingomonas sp.]|nr:hypothetical protein [Sphingomonas sp.]
MDKNLPNYDPQYYTVQHEFRRAEYVVKAKVLKEIWLGEDGKPKPLQPPFQNGAPRPWGFDPYIGAFYDLQIEKVFKGEPPMRIRLFSENSTARFWLKVGSEQLLFITEDTFEQPVGRQLTMDICGNSEPFSMAQALLRQIRHITQTRR